MKFLFLILSLTPGLAMAKELALTFDDSPRFANGYFDGPTRAQKLIESLAKAQIGEVAFFTVTSNMDSEGKARIESYSHAGHIIANHTHTHPDFNQTDTATYVADFRKADSLLSSFSTFEKWFRFPMLREGDQIDKRDQMRQALRNQGYRNAYITINNYDWYMESLFQEAILKNPKLNFEKLKRFYIENLLAAIEYYDKMALQHLGRSPKHVILLHETDLSALFVADLISALRRLGWKMISPREAYQDEISSFETNRVFKYNPGRIGEIAREKGQQTGLWHESCDEDYLDAKFNEQVLGK